MSELSKQIELFFTLKLRPNSPSIMKKWIHEIENDLEVLQKELKLNNEKLRCALKVRKYKKKVKSKIIKRRRSGRVVRGKKRCELCCKHE